MYNVGSGLDVRYKMERVYKRGGRTEKSKDRQARAVEIGTEIVKRNLKSAIKPLGRNTMQLRNTKPSQLHRASKTGILSFSPFV